MFYKQKDVIIFSSIDWNDHWQIHHTLVTNLLDQGARILFIENTGIRKIKFKDYSRIIKRFKNWLKGVNGVNKKSTNFYIYSPIFLPLPYNFFARKINFIIYKYVLFKWFRNISFKPDISICFLPTPLNQVVIKSIFPVLSIYYCVDNLSKGSIEAQKITKWENNFFADADLVFYTSEEIKNRAIRFNKNLYKFSAGVDYKKFFKAFNSKIIPKELQNIDKPIIGYVGAISNVFDQSLFNKMTNKFTDCIFVIIGPSYINTDSIFNKKNILYLGIKSHDEIPYYIKHFSVSIIPYIKNEFTDSVFSCKINEHLSLGIPIVAPDLLEFVYFNKENKIINICKNHNDFIENTEDIIKTKKSKNISFIKKAVSIAKKNDWKNIFSNMNKIINLNFNKSLNKLDLNWRNKILFENKLLKKIAITFVFIFGIIFYSPLYWYLGSKLILIDTDIQNDVIVVFSGNGDNAYINPGYQNRVVDTLKYYKKGENNKIIISSGRVQTFKEEDLIVSLLVSNSVDPNDIHLFEQYPSSTYENVILVGNYLKENNIKNILFLTAPYHYLRSNLIWNKNFPDIKITNLKNIDSPSTKIQWVNKWSNIKIINYEILSIIKNYLLKNL